MTTITNIRRIPSLIAARLRPAFTLATLGALAATCHACGEAPRGRYELCDGCDAEYSAYLDGLDPFECMPER